LIDAASELVHSYINMQYLKNQLALTLGPNKCTKAVVYSRL